MNRCWVKRGYCYKCGRRKCKGGFWVTMLSFAEMFHPPCPCSQGREPLCDDCERYVISHQGYLPFDQKCQQPHLGDK